MSNVPQDVIDDAKASGFAIEVHEPTGRNLIYAPYENEDRHGYFIVTDELLKFAQLRALRNNAEPVAWGVFALVNDKWILQHPAHSNEIDAKRHAEIYVEGTQIEIRELYSAPPDAGVAAGMIKSAEIAKQVEFANAAYNDDKALVAAETARFIKREILSAIPDDSKAALRERDRELCFQAAGLAWAIAAPDKQIDTAALLRAVNSVLEGKS